MNDKFLKPYSPQDTEGNIYKLWEESGFFNPDTCIEKGITTKDAEPFTIVMPPPNVTGQLHMGHAMMLTIQDIMIRYKRMKGFKTLWLPGTDHAAIATQSKVEKDILKTEGKNRNDLGREEMLRRINAFAKESHDTIANQIRAMGASCDWSREAFTLDEKRNLAVNSVFKKMYDDGLIYQGHRIVNWDPKGQTTIADDEIVYAPEKTKFYYFKYGPFTIGTSRPETKFGDKYVVMHPDDTRYKEYTHGQKLTVEWINGPIEATVIKDDCIDMTFGTGVMTITPWHSTVDFEIAERHKLDKEQIIDKYGKLLPIAGEAFAGLKIKDAREKIVTTLEAKGLVEKIEDYTHNIATAERTGGVIEPQIMNQWFIAVNKEFTLPYSNIAGIASGSKTTLKEIMRKVVSEKQIKIIPEYFDKTYFHWIDNLRDWCISRQIWYGHRIPVFYKGDKIVVGDKPAEEGFVQDEDTLDTWFSSGLWTFSTLGWPENTADLKTYHPTDVLETGYDILFFWVARMILMTGYVLGDIPFKTVYLNGIVRDAKGQKFSKSLGNGIDPLDVAREFGADAGRMALIYSTAPGTDSKISNDKIKGYKHFANKLWNITRFVLTNTRDITPEVSFSKWSDADNTLIQEREKLVSEVTKEFDEYMFHISAEKIYQYVWTRFADVILEESKKIFTDGTETEKISRKQFLRHTLEVSLKLIHPFMPFVTEEIWQSMDKKNLLMTERWPS
jgi:valyl-tRNA synthetase